MGGDMSQGGKYQDDAITPRKLEIINKKITPNIDLIKLRFLFSR